MRTDTSSMKSSPRPTRSCWPTLSPWLTCWMRTCQSSHRTRRCRKVWELLSQPEEERAARVSHLLAALSDHGPGIDIFTPGKPGEYDLEGGIWEDEDARNFYENMVDLKAFVPAILFKDNEKSSQSKDKEETRGDVSTCSQRKSPAVSHRPAVCAWSRWEGGQGRSGHHRGAGAGTGGS